MLVYHSNYYIVDLHYGFILGLHSGFTLGLRCDITLGLHCGFTLGWHCGLTLALHFLFTLALHCSYTGVTLRLCPAYVGPTLDLCFSCHFSYAINRRLEISKSTVSREEHDRILISLWSSNDHFVTADQLPIPCTGQLVPLWLAVPQCYSGNN